jgi:hypothetical protein
MAAFPSFDSRFHLLHVCDVLPKPIVLGFQAPDPEAEQEASGSRGPVCELHRNHNAICPYALYCVNCFVVAGGPRKLLIHRDRSVGFERHVTISIRHTDPSSVRLPQREVCDSTRLVIDRHQGRIIVEVEALVAEIGQGRGMGMVLVMGISPRNILPA